MPRIYRNAVVITRSQASEARAHRNQRQSAEQEASKHAATTGHPIIDPDLTEAFPQVSIMDSRVTTRARDITVLWTVRCARIPRAIRRLET